MREPAVDGAACRASGVAADDNSRHAAPPEQVRTDIETTREETTCRSIAAPSSKGVLAAGASLAVLKAPAVHGPGRPDPASASSRVKTGPLASGGIQMEQGVTRLLQGARATSSPAAGRAAHRRHRRQPGAGAHQDAGAGRARSRSTCIIGPLAAFEALAIDDYIRSSQTPILTRRRRRGHDAAQGQPVAGAAELAPRRSRAIRSATTPPRS